MKFKEIKAYPCDPERNTECNKSSCYLHGGPCSKTTNPIYRKRTPEEEFPIRIKKEKNTSTKNTDKEAL